jgi:hypothetical protein
MVPAETATAKRQMNCMGPKKRDRHYSYNEGLDEAPKLIEDESVEVEEAVPADENEAIERDDENEKPDAPAFED